MKNLTTFMLNNIINMQTWYHSKNNGHRILWYAFFWVIPQCLKFIWLYTYPPIKLEQTECSEMLAYKIQTPWNYPEEIIQHSEHGECSKSRIVYCLYFPSPLWHTDILLVSSRKLHPFHVCSLSTNSWVHNALHICMLSFG